jgi:hypothetical protein
MVAIGGGVSVAKAQCPWTVVVGPWMSSPSTNRVIRHISSKDRPANPTGSHQYIRRKPCTYFASRLTLFPTRLKQSCTWSTPPRSTIWCAQSDFRAYLTFGANRAPILLRD